MSKFDDTCPMCNHTIKAPDLAWQTVKSHEAMIYCANYCDELTCTVEGCAQNCINFVTDVKVNEEKVLHEMVRRRRKIERINKSEE